MYSEDLCPYLDKGSLKAYRLLVWQGLNEPVIFRILLVEISRSWTDIQLLVRCMPAAAVILTDQLFLRERERDQTVWHGTNSDLAD